MIRAFLFLCIAFGPPFAAADFDLSKKTLLEPVFKEVDRPWMVQGVLEFPFYSFYLGAPAVHGVAYLPNFAPRMGPKIIYKDVGAQVTLGLPIPGTEKHRRGDTTHTGLNLSSYWRRVAMDLYYHRFRGFYVASPFTELSFNKPERYPQLPDARVLTYGVNFYFVFEPDRYSLRAAFDLTEFQTRSGGSWMYNPFFNHLQMSIGNEFVPGIGNDALIDLPNLASGRMDTAGFAFGYGYTYIFKHFFATAQGGIGPGVQFQRIQRNDGNDTEVITYAAKLNVNFSTGYNYVDYVAGFKVLLDTLWAEVSDTQVYSSLINAQFFLGHRF